ncbi:MAG: hypothetical protein IJ593_04125, partial [Lachnospiraceae bacterium]|nr:hypothetical protein [Lachnospiraceae bacterium]
LRNHFNENNDTGHPVSGVKEYQAVGNFTDFKNYIESNATMYSYIYLNHDIVVTDMVKITKPLFLCLNDFKLSFTANGQLCTYYDEGDANPDIYTLGNYPYAICICGCADVRSEGATTDDGADGFCGYMDGQNIGRTAPAIFYTKSKGVYFYGLGNNGAVNQSESYVDAETRIKIKNFIASTSVIDSYKPRKAQKYTNSSREERYFSYPNNYLYNTKIADRDNYDDYSSSFLTMSINDPDQATDQTVRQAFFYALDVEGMSSNDGGFANLYYVNSVAIEHCKFTDVSAFRGGVISADYNNRRFLKTTGTSVMNDYIDIGHSQFTQCGLGGTFKTSASAHGLADNLVWGTEGKYKNGTRANRADTTIDYGDDVIYRPDVNGLILLENYNGGSTQEIYRIIKGNEFANNFIGQEIGGVANSQAYAIYLTFDSVGANTTNITGNTFDNNMGGAVFVENLYNERNCKALTEKSEGTIYFDNNIVNENILNTAEYGLANRPDSLAVVNFEKVGTVLINSKASTQQSIEESYGIGTGAVKISCVNMVYVYKTAFKNNAANSNGREGLGGNIHLSTCSTVYIGNQNVEQAEKVSFEDTASATPHTRLGGGIYAYDVNSLNIADTKFTNLHASENGGAIYMK